MSPDHRKQNGTAGRPVWRLFWLAVLALGVAGWWLALAGESSDRAWRALLVNFLFFTPLAAGLVAWPAIVVASNGRWSRGLESSALGALWFAPVSLLAFLLLILGGPHWAPWMHEEFHGFKGLWLDARFLFARDALALAGLWAFAARFARRRAGGERSGWNAGLMAFLYAVIFSLLGFDLVMALEPRWFSTLFGGYFFITGLYAAVAAWALAVLIDFGHEANQDRLQDLANLIKVFSLLAVGFMFSQLLPIWYENLPEEVIFVIPRRQVTDWRWVSLGLLFTIYLGPLVLLLTRRSRRSRLWLTGVTLLLLAGLWVERWWLVYPSLELDPVLGPAELSVTAAFLAAFVLARGEYASRLRRTEEAPG